MSSRPKKISFKGVSNKNKTSLNQNLEALEQIVFINVKSNLDENDDPAKRKTDSKPTVNILKLSPLLLRIVSRKYKNNNIKTQKEAFNAAMKYSIIVGQIIGLFPLFSFKGGHVPKEKCQMLSWRYVFSIFMTLSELLAAILCFRSLVSAPVTINNLSYFSFYAMTFVSSILFLRLSTKWNYLMNQIETAELNEYIDPLIGYKCNFAAIVILGLAVVEHTLSIAVKLIAAEECVSNSTGILKPFIIKNYYYIYTLDVSYSKGFGIYLVVKNYLITLIWSYLHLFVVCISLYLTSILTQINKVILSREGQYLSPSCWRKFREDYNRASRLVRCFDDAINSIVLMSFASNMYFCCLRLYFILLNGFQLRPCSYYYPNSGEKDSAPGLLYGYTAIAFSIYSLSFVLLRSLAVSLIAAKVHSASLVVAPVLYSVPSPTFCTEIQRFIEQIHGDTVALTGLNFFYVTKELILTNEDRFTFFNVANGVQRLKMSKNLNNMTRIVGTIVTYELVLVQFVKN